MIPLMIMAGAQLANGLFNKQKAPNAVPFKPVNLQDEQRNAIEGNLANQDDIEQLIGRANSFTQDQATSLMERALPGFSGLRDKFLAQANKAISDPYGVPKEVEDNLARIAAERGISAGTRGEFNDFSLLRDFGINALEYGKSRLGDAQSLLGTIATLTPRVNPMSPMSMYVTPQQAAQVAGSNAAQEQAVAQGNENSKTAASNWNQSNLWNSLTMAAAFAGAAVKPAAK